MNFDPKRVQTALMIAKKLASSVDPGFANINPPMPPQGVPLERAEGGSVDDDLKIARSIGADTSSIPEIRKAGELNRFRQSMIGDVQSSAQKMADLGQQYHESGLLPHPIGTMLLTPDAQQNKKPPMKVVGHYVDFKNPSRYGYFTEQGDATGIAMVSDPAADERIRKYNPSWNREKYWSQTQLLKGPQGFAKARGGIVDDDKSIRRALMIAKADGGKLSEEPSATQSNISPTANPKRILVSAEGKGGVRGIVVPRHMWEGTDKAAGMREVNRARAEVYGSENRDPLTIGQIGKIHKQTLDEHFAKPVKQQIEAEKAALQRLQKARHITPGADTLDESEKLDTVRHETDDEGRNYVAYGSKGVAGHALYTSGYGPNQKQVVLNTCPGQTDGCGGGVGPDGIVDTSRGTCFAPNAESQYVNAAIRRACHAQAKHDPAMTRDWVLAHTGALRNAAQRADKKNQVVLFRPNVVDESDTSSRYVINNLNKQRIAQDKPAIIANSYGKTNELHDPENGYFVTYSNAGPKTKLGYSVAENISRDKQRVRATISATDAAGRDFQNEQGNNTPPKNSYMVTDVKRGSDLNKAMEKSFKYAKYWSAPREQNALSQDELAEGPEGHYDGNGNPTTPDKAHYGHTTLNGLRYDYQKQHILHPRLVQVGLNDDGTPHMIPTDSRFKDNEFLPKNRFMTKNGKQAGAILMTTPTTSTSNLGHQTSFTHHVDDEDIAYAKKNRGEYEIDSPQEQEASIGKEYIPPQEIKFRADGGAVHAEADNDDLAAFPEQSYAAQRHNAHKKEEHDENAHHHSPRLHQAPNPSIDRALQIASRIGVVPGMMGLVRRS